MVLRSWNPKRYAGSVSLQADVNHGTFFWRAYEENLIKPNSSIHAGIRTRFGVSEARFLRLTADIHNRDWKT